MCSWQGAGRLAIQDDHPSLFDNKSMDDLCTGNSTQNACLRLFSRDGAPINLEW